jgi:asparagine synthase (glutamine-hydrolysing)
VQSGVASVARGVTAAAGRGALYADIINRAARRREHFWGGAVALWESMKAPLVRPERFDGAASHGEGDGIVPAGFFRADTYEVVAHHLAEFDRAVPDADVLARMTYLEFKQRLPELLLMRVDKISMSTSVEARVPFLDHELVEFTMGLPLNVKVGNGIQKKLLKQVARGVIPDQVIDRPKVGFGAPMKEWLRGEFGRHAEAAVMSSPLRAEALFDYDRVRELFARHRAGQDRSLPIWILYNLTAWYDTWFAARA